MANVAKVFVIGFFGAIAVFTIFFKAGSAGGGANQSGGQQFAQIIKAGGGSLGSLGASLETGQAPAAGSY